MARLAYSCAAFLSATALVAACSVYDESLLGAGGADDTSTSGKTSGGDGGDGGAGNPTTATTGTEATTATSTGQTGTVTTGSQCDTPDDCPGEDSDCSIRTCEGNVCSILNKEAGFVIPAQTVGDCIVQTCDGLGNLVSDVDDSDLPAQTDDCLVPVCNNGLSDVVDADVRTPCGTDFLCDGAGVCVECIDDNDCAERCSEANTCVQAQCDDNMANGQETDIDCGGPVCEPCGNGLACDADSDCVSGDCAGTCQASCSDGAQNNGESAIDCGGPNCNPCGVGLGCNDLDDCSSGFCLEQTCRPLLYFSEYVEGSSFNKAVEIFNFGNEPIDLDTEACSIRISRNGGSTVADIGLTGSIDTLGAPAPATPTHVVCFQPSAPNMLAPELLAKCDQQSSALNHNGNDALILSCGGVVLDNFGQVGTDPGASGWGTGTTSTVDHTLRRKGSILEGDRNGADAFVPATEWDGFAVDTFTGLGDHP